MEPLQSKGVSQFNGAKNRIAPGVVHQRAGYATFLHRSQWHRISSDFVSECMGQFDMGTRTPESFRLRAEQLRSLADLDLDMDNRDMLCGIADGYDRLANSLDAFNPSGAVLAQSQNSN